MSIVERIRQVTAQKEISLAEMERDLGFSNCSIRKWDKASPSVDKVKAVAEYLDVSVDWLVEDIEVSKPKHTTIVVISSAIRNNWLTTSQMR